MGSQYYELHADSRGLIAARPKGVHTPIRKPKKNSVQLLWKGVQRLHALPRTLNAICTPSIGVHVACRRAEPARLSGGACKACTPFGQACRLCTPVGSRYGRTLIRVRKDPYKGTKVPLWGYGRTLIRVPKYPYRLPNYPYKGTEGPL
ncbi:hypothetical protein PCANC_04138 [Puccinia coronata f. sp. avenae]|uniref:Uncharacterized protein n=1 Tax=Puccinia coronata f. sp. avenae TaxID=200324 RepID=A0A2N5W778_9BASI|nr:hypothetical protein PCANC_04138 [Puccinia coronata f. sp. avenae]